MSLRETPVSRCLEKKFTMLGYEILDLIAIFLLLSVLNFIFGQTPLKIPLVWVPTLSLSDRYDIGEMFLKSGSCGTYGSQVLAQWDYGYSDMSRLEFNEMIDAAISFCEKETKSVAGKSMRRFIKIQRHLDQSCSSSWLKTEKIPSVADRESFLLCRMKSALYVNGLAYGN